MKERIVTVAELKDLLEEVAESRKGTAGLLEDEDVLLASQKAALDHAQKTAKLSTEKANALIEELSKLNEMTDAIAVKVADILPQYPEDVHTILQKERISDEPKMTKEILSIVEKYS